MAYSISFEVATGQAAETACVVEAGGAVGKDDRAEEAVLAVGEGSQVEGAVGTGGAETAVVAGRTVWQH